MNHLSLRLAAAALAILALVAAGCGEKPAEPGKNDTPVQTEQRKEKTGD